MSGICNHLAQSEFRQAEQHFREARQETGRANQHFAEAQHQFSEAQRDFVHGNIVGGLNHTLEGQRQDAKGREDLAKADRDRSEAFEHLVNGMDLSRACGGGAFGGFPGGLGPNTDPGFTPFPPGRDIGPGINPFPPGHDIDPGFNPFPPGPDIDPGMTVHGGSDRYVPPAKTPEINGPVIWEPDFKGMVPPGVDDIVGGAVKSVEKIFGL